MWVTNEVGVHDNWEDKDLHEIYNSSETRAVTMQTNIYSVLQMQLWTWTRLNYVPLHR